MSDARAPAAPIPSALYIWDDLSAAVHRRHGIGSPAGLLCRDLLTRVVRDPQRVKVLAPETQLERLTAKIRCKPFGRAVGIGEAGERVARKLHRRTARFPRIRRLDIARFEDGRGGYRLMSTNGVSLSDQLRRIARTAGTLAVVDDTVFSGLTLRTVLGELPNEVRARTQTFCLRGVRATLSEIAELCPVRAGFSVAGKLPGEVSMINASGLVLPIGIRRIGRPPLAFFQRPTWMRAWFPAHADEVIALCRRLNALLDGRSLLRSR